MIEVKVLGSVCANSEKIVNLIEDVTNENGIVINLEKIEDMAEIISHETPSTPCVLVDNKIVHAGGIPDKKTILSWFASS